MMSDYLNPQLNQQATILQKIVADKQHWIAERQARQPLSTFQGQVTPSDRDFYAALKPKAQPHFILECKKASPSKGLIRAEFDPTEIARVYKNYASAISVLTDEHFFQGDFAFIQQVRAIASQPVLCKDFIISEYQVYLARHSQADAILLMLSVLSDTGYTALSTLAHRLGMCVLTEVANEAELERALALGAKVIGINNRDLHDLSVDLTRTPPLAQKIPADRTVVSESGIYTHEQVRQLQGNVNAFLIGSSLMGSADLQSAVRSVIFGENKVCGLTRAQDAKCAFDAGALYGGLIFAEASPRALSLRQAQEVATAAPLRYVGVFQNQPIELIVRLASQLGLYAVQLHGAEDRTFIKQLRAALPDAIEIWQAVAVAEGDSAVILPDDDNVNRFVCDTRVGTTQGGTGQAFDWALLREEDKQRIMLAGGLNLANARQAAEMGCLGLDINSGVESAPGVKDCEKLTALLQCIR
ncbi:bifunctional indole-3-glycerol-phosphate synthase TrpC/phosphoribosylanthranilate isomerase TrpF [Pasteurellaceae bacterium 20609_3]|uniref:bifunctional indole-3-glycerol-phosphate synthase TrpC/phosphoribosylanthranilate isomerase TrpF n=1 Tax=Spirabiliibacterium mucosae TaxID=28156 RepID=UPI001AAC6492|nr:bifunctional indole-3-glycerol-phosphate synthase TrpC/phosphoribosylanthranilate isomerase TrpF [Spirabiliibacterium mucosae]MBE2898591.1 bifunctional indole-3-glycerol-phosphate synthase TrpC/phosphoribosylanthranilate isomerase TrpF [Spirabiliibacterium mucosae]